MAKVSKHFVFHMPITKIENGEIHLAATLEVSGIGYQWDNVPEQSRFGNDIEDVRLVGGKDNIKDFVMLNYKKEIQAAAASQVRYVFGFKNNPELVSEFIS